MPGALGGAEPKNLIGVTEDKLHIGSQDGSSAGTLAVDFHPKQIGLLLQQPLNPKFQSVGVLASASRPPWILVSCLAAGQAAVAVNPPNGSNTFLALDAIAW